MASLALPTGDLFSVITTGRHGREPAWKSLLNWPSFGDAHIDYAADTPTQRNIWAAHLDEAVLRADKPVLLVASGESCFATAWWARLSPASYVSKVAGALLFTPMPQGRVKTGTLEEFAQKFASPRVTLPFPTAIVDGAGITDQRVQSLAESWGSGFLDTAGETPALPGSATAWQQAQNAVMRLTARVVEHDLRIARTLRVEL